MTAPESLGGSGYHRNWLTVAGVAMVFLGFAGSVLLWIVELLSPRAAPYVGVNYLGFTALLLIGFVLIPAGMLRERRRQRSRAGIEKAAELSFDLTTPAHRYAAVSLFAGALVVVLLVGIGTYRSYQASESTSFCGELCHSVMEPEWTTYHSSSHARVKCVECHIGSGAGWFVRSKLSGLRQVWATTISSYPRPIPTPIRDLRPARETCEECHWRRKFTGYKENVRSYFLATEDNALHGIRMLVKIGGEKTAFLKGSGIHYHMLIASHVEYIASDERRQEIAWVRVTRGDGSVTEYHNADSPLSDEERAEMEVRTMDCMDCHNRPAHQFLSPARSVNDSLEQGTISAGLPYIKLRAVQALDADYATTDDAVVGIANSIRGFYRGNYPEVIEKRGDELGRSIRRVQEIYQSSIFPTMKAKWSVYPNNIGHLESAGCFRCHTDAMQAADGTSIFTTCNKCHLILAQGESIEQVNVNLEEGLPFVHPGDYETMEDYEECVDCHTGGAEVYE